MIYFLSLLITCQIIGTLIIYYLNTTLKEMPVLIVIIALFITILLPPILGLAFYYGMIKPHALKSNLREQT